jgi:carboxyl-terminal processing protease
MNLTGSGMKGLIVDLRDNPGGLLDSSTSLLQNFIPEGKLLVETRSNEQDLEHKYFSEGPGIVSMPMVVLINENSASASEIFAGAIQDYERGIVVGAKSYGKGSVQITYPLRNDGELKITVARWYTPKNRGIDGIGIQPDVESKVEDADFEKQYDRVLDEGTKALKKIIGGASISSFKK